MCAGQPTRAWRPHSNACVRCARQWATETRCSRTEHAREIDGLQRAADKQWARSVEGSVEAGVPCAEAERRALPMANCHTLCSTLRCPFTGDGALDLLRAKHANVAETELERIAALPPVAACDAELALTRPAARVASDRPRHAVLYVQAASTETD